MNRCTDSDGNFPDDPDNLPDGCDEATFEVDSENGKLDASTVLFNPKGGDCDFKTSLIGEEDDYCVLYNTEQIRNGGETRSVESGANIFSKVCAQDLGLFIDAPPILSSSMPFDVVPGEEPDPQS